jgi:ADP-dependent NAD(P)H-hydrate dehydratase / NAD(P)H-hydrate epimerase
VSVATQPEHIYMVSITRPELMCHGVYLVEQYRELLKKADVIVIGPGLGKSNWSKKLLNMSLGIAKPMVLDADGLNLLSTISSIKIWRDNWILTPHPTEAARLLNTDTQTVQRDRFSALSLLREKFGGTCVLKGAGTLVVGEGELVGACTAGNPGMASGGMGDILSGIIGGLLAQGMEPLQAAKLGVLLHAHAGDMEAKANGARGMLAMDLLEHVRKML